MSHVRVEKTSVEFLDIPVTANVDLEIIGEPQVAFVRGYFSELPDTPDWVDAVVTGTGLRVTYGTDVELERGRYTVYVRFADAPEVPVEPCENLLIVY